MISRTSCFSTLQSLEARVCFQYRVGLILTSAPSHGYWSLEIKNWTHHLCIDSVANLNFPFSRKVPTIGVLGHRHSDECKFCQARQNAALDGRDKQCRLYPGLGLRGLTTITALPVESLFYPPNTNRTSFDLNSNGGIVNGNVKKAIACYWVPVLAPWQIQCHLNMLSCVFYNSSKCISLAKIQTDI